MSGKRKDAGRSPSSVAANWGSRRIRRALIAAALIFFGIMGLDRFDPPAAYRWIPGPLLFFAQMSGLFPYADRHIIDYRAEAWLCGEQRFAPADETPYFPVLAGTKESRFHRTLYFYHNHRPTMRALDDYLTRHFAQGKEFAGQPVGGVRFLLVDAPIPHPGETVERFRRPPLDSIPPAELHVLYYTPLEMRIGRCGEAP